MSASVDFNKRKPSISIGHGHTLGHGRKASLSASGGIIGGVHRDSHPGRSDSPPVQGTPPPKETSSNNEGTGSPDLAPGHDAAMDHIREKKRIMNRRRTAINQGEIARANLLNESGGLAAMRMGAAKAKPPSIQYQRQWSGLSRSGRDVLKRKDVEFKAYFEKPLEQFIYPSLQLVENSDTVHTKEREQYQRLHGHNDNHFVTRFDAHFPMANKYLTNEHTPQAAYGGTDAKAPVQECATTKLIPSSEADLKSAIKQSAWSVGFSAVPDPPDKDQRDKFEGDMKKGENHLRGVLRKKYEMVKERNQEEEKNRRLQAMVTAPVKDAQPVRSRAVNSFGQSHYKAAPSSVVVSFGSIDTPDSLVCLCGPSTPAAVFIDYI